MLAGLRRAGFSAEITARAAYHQVVTGYAARNAPRTRHVFLAIADHFEPGVGRAPDAIRARRMSDWMGRYPEIASRHRDADGRHPAHTFFYPWDEYEDGEVQQLAELCSRGFGEVEIHLHHESDTDTSLRSKFRAAAAAYRDHGCLSEWADGSPAWGFVHGNWALDNSRCEQGRNYCGVNNELTILHEEGCYADFTFPAWKQSAQPRSTNQILRSGDDPTRPKSYDRASPVRAGLPDSRLLLVQGPLVPFIQLRGIRPRLAMDDGDLASYHRYHPDRLDRWVRAGIHVAGKSEWVFIKLHCHGAADGSREALLTEDLERLFSDAENRYNDGKQFQLHYVTTREMFNLVCAAEADYCGTPHGARDFVLDPPRASGRGFHRAG